MFLLDFSIHNYTRIDDFKTMLSYLATDGLNTIQFEIKNIEEKND